MNPASLLKYTFFVSALNVASGCQTTKEPSQLALGNEYAKQGLIREAIDQYRKVLNDDPDNVAGNRNLGIMLVKSGDYKNAARHLEISAKKIPLDFDLNYYLGEACRAEGRYGDAVYYYQQSLRIKPSDPRSLKALAWSFFKMRYYAEALSNVKKLMRIEPSDSQAAVIAARIYIKLKRFDEALATIQGAMSSTDKLGLPYLKSIEGDIFFNLGELARAKQAYSIALKEGPLTASALFGMGRVMKMANDKKRAVNYFERALRVRPELAEAHYLLGEILEETNPKLARMHLEIFTKLAATDPDLIPEVEKSRKRLRLSKQ